jgi:hypothetical protein
MAQQPPPGDDLYHMIEGDPNQPGPAIVYTHNFDKQFQITFSESFAVADVKPTVIKIHGGDFVVDVVGPASASAPPTDPPRAPIKSPRARRRPSLLEVGLFCLPRRMREDCEGFIGDLLERCAEKAAEGWSRPLLVVTGTVQVVIMLTASLWRTGVLKALGLLRLLGL